MEEWPVHHFTNTKKPTQGRLIKTGRGREIRTPDILLPKQARYQTALYPVNLDHHTGPVVAYYPYFPGAVNWQKSQLTTVRTNTMSGGNFLWFEFVGNWQPD